jgi:hypothetical protein
MKWLALVLAIPVLMLAGAVALNRPPLFAAPGPWVRLQTYFTTNVAETRPDHPFPELRTPRLPTDVAGAREAILAAMEKLGWKQIRARDDTIQAVVTSALFRFRDDVTVRLAPTDGGTLLHARSASRIGKGDLAANARHLQDLFAAVGARTPNEAS